MGGDLRFPGWDASLEEKESGEDVLLCAPKELPLRMCRSPARAHGLRGERDGNGDAVAEGGLTQLVDRLPTPPT